MSPTKTMYAIPSPPDIVTIYTTHSAGGINLFFKTKRCMADGNAPRLLVTSINVCFWCVVTRNRNADQHKTLFPQLMKHTFDNTNAQIHNTLCAFSSSGAMTMDNIIYWPLSHVFIRLQQAPNAFYAILPSHANAPNANHHHLVFGPPDADHRVLARNVCGRNAKTTNWRWVCEIVF